MSTLFALPLLLAVLGSSATAVSLEHTEPAPGVHVFSSSPDGYVPGGHSVLVVGPDDALVFDTFTRPSTARALVKQIRAVTSRPVRWIVNSHWHPDHWFGNEVLLAAFPGAQIVATEETRQLMLATMNTWKSRFLAELGTPSDDPRSAETILRREFLQEALTVAFKVPSLTFTDRLVLRQGTREIQLLSMVGDARGTTVLWLPLERLVATGDVVSGPVPYFTPPLSLHASSLRALLSLRPTTVVPGHGPVRRDTGQVELQLELYESILQQTRTAAEAGEVTVEDVQQKVHVGAFRSRFTGGSPKLDAQFDRYVSRMVENAYRDLRDGKSFTR